MKEYVPKDALIAEIERWLGEIDRGFPNDHNLGRFDAYKRMLSLINTLEVKEVGLMIHTIIAECCDWLAMNTNLSHDKIEECRNSMLTVKEEQFKVQEGKKV